MTDTLDEIRDDIWHLLLHLHAYQQKSQRILDVSPTRREMGWELTARIAMANEITMRVARLGDPTKGVRSIKNALNGKGKKDNPNRDRLQREFCKLVEPVLKQRNTNLAHSAPGNLSSLPFEPLLAQTTDAISVLVPLVDEMAGTKVRYLYRSSSAEMVTDLRASVQTGTVVDA